MRGADRKPVRRQAPAPANGVRIPFCHLFVLYKEGCRSRHHQRARLRIRALQASFIPVPRLPAITRHTRRSRQCPTGLVAPELATKVRLRNSVVGYFDCGKVRSYPHLLHLLGVIGIHTPRRAGGCKTFPTGCLHLGQRTVTAQIGKTNIIGKSAKFCELTSQIPTGNPTSKDAASKRWYLKRGDTLSCLLSRLPRL